MGEFKKEDEVGARGTPLFTSMDSASLPAILERVVWVSITARRTFLTVVGI